MLHTFIYRGFCWFEVLKRWGFEKNTSHSNVIPKGAIFVSSDTFGARRGRSGGLFITPETTVSPLASQ